MAIENVAVDEPVKASTHNSIINRINGSPHREFILANAVWSVPADCPRFRVYLMGGGGYSQPNGIDLEANPVIGDMGGFSTIGCKDISADEGTSYSVVIGAGGTSSTDGGTSSFGAVMTAAGGESGEASTGINGANGAPTGADSFHGNGWFTNNVGVPYGGAYKSNPNVGQNGSQGLCVIEW